MRRELYLVFAFLIKCFLHVKAPKLSCGLLTSLIECHLPFSYCLWNLVYVSFDPSFLTPRSEHVSFTRIPLIMSINDLLLVNDWEVEERNYK